MAHYSVMCTCGHKMRIRRRHIGRMCRCTRCDHPIYVTPDSVEPPLKNSSASLPRIFHDAAEVPLNWKKGDLIADIYEVKEHIGAGGMGDVYRVYHRGWEVDLAVKFPKPHLVEAVDWLTLFEEECRTWINLHPHPNVVQCFYVRRLGNVPRVFIEYVPGTHLGAVIENKSIYTADQDRALETMLDLVIQTASGLAHAHQAGVVHRDVKPLNVLVTGDQRAKVTDFGLAINPDDAASREVTDDAHSVSGTPLYSAPEQSEGDPGSFRSDVWGWAALVTEVFSGGVTWHDHTELPEKFEGLVEYGAWDTSIPRLPDGLTDILRSCLQADAANRPQNCAEILPRLFDVYEQATGRPYAVRGDTPQEISQARLNNRAVSLLNLEQSEDSESIWNAVLTEHPDDFAAKYNRMLHHWRTGQIRDVALNKFLSDECHALPDDAQRRSVYARVLCEQGRASAAAQMMNEHFRPEIRRRDFAFALALAENKQHLDRHPLGPVATPAMLTAAAPLGDGEQMVAGFADGEMSIIDPATLTYHVGRSMQHSASVVSIDTSQRGDRGVSLDASGAVRIWDLANRTRIAKLSQESEAYRSIAIHPAGAVCAVGNDRSDIWIFNLETGQSSARLRGHRSRINCLRFSPDGTQLLSGSKDGSVRLWDLASNRCEKAFPVDSGEVTTVTFGHNDATIIATHGQCISIFERNTAAVRLQIEAHHNPIHSYASSPCGRFGMSAAVRGTARVWDLESGQCISSLPAQAPVSATRSGRWGIAGEGDGATTAWEFNLGEIPYCAPYVMHFESVGGEEESVEENSDQESDDRRSPT